MDENVVPGQEPTPLPKIPDPNQPKRKFSFSKAVYLIIFLFILSVSGFLFFTKFIGPKLNKKITPPPAKQASTSAKPKPDTFSVGYVTAPEGLNLRAKPSADSTLIVLLPYGTQVNVIDHQGDWLFVEAQTKGFVTKDFVSATKPTGITLGVFKDDASPFTFLYPQVYKLTFTKTAADLEYSFIGNDSYGGFSVVTVPNQATIGNYALINFSGAKTGPCSVQFSGGNIKECEQVTTSDNQTLYLILNNTTLYKISYLKTEGGLLTDLENLVFYSLFFK